MIQRLVDKLARPRIEADERRKTEPFLSLCREARETLERMSQRGGPTCPAQT